MYGGPHRTDRQPRARPRAYVNRDVDMSITSPGPSSNPRTQHTPATTSNAARPALLFFGSSDAIPAPAHPHTLHDDHVWSQSDGAGRTPSVLLLPRPTSTRRGDAALHASPNGDQSAIWQGWNSRPILGPASPPAIEPTRAFTSHPTFAPAPATASAPGSGVAPIASSSHVAATETAPDAIPEEMEEALEALCSLGSVSSGSPPDLSGWSSVPRDTVALPRESSLSPSVGTSSRSGFGIKGMTAPSGSAGSTSGYAPSASSLASSHRTADMSRSPSSATDIAAAPATAASRAGIKPPSSRKRSSSEESTSPKRSRLTLRNAPRAPASAAPRTSQNPDAWTEAAQEAYEEAVKAISPCDRQQFRFLGRNFGRNELIGLWVTLATGDYCGRKRISSHTQTMRAVHSPGDFRDLLTTDAETRKRLAAEKALNGNVKPAFEVPPALRRLVEDAHLDSTGETLAHDVSMAELPLPPFLVRYKCFGEGSRASASTSKGKGETSRSGASGRISSGSDDSGGIETMRQMTLEDAIAQDKADQRAKNAQSKAAHSKQAETRVRQSHVKAAVASGQPVRAPSLPFSLDAPVPPPPAPPAKMTRSNSRIRRAAEQVHPVAGPSTSMGRNGRITQDAQSWLGPLPTSVRQPSPTPAPSSSASPEPEPVPEAHQRQFSGPGRLASRRPSAIDTLPPSPSSIFAPMRFSPQFGALSNVRRSSITDVSSSPSSVSVGPGAYAGSSSSYVDAQGERPSSANRGGLFGSTASGDAPMPSLPPIHRLLPRSPDAYSPYARQGIWSTSSPILQATSNSRESPEEDDALGLRMTNERNCGGRGQSERNLPSISALFRDAPNRGDYSNGFHFSSPRH